MNKKSRMYEVNGTRVRTWNPFVGYKFNCSYCYAPEIYKRFSKCEQCKAFIPHFHPERLQQKFKAGETVFVCSMGDISFATTAQWKLIFHTIRQYPKTTFLLQSKNPQQFTNFERRYDYPFNCVLGTTIESDYDHFVSMCSIRHISKAPLTIYRRIAMINLHHRKYVTIESIFDFDLETLILWIKEIAPEFVYIGYLNPERKAKKLQLQEPPLQKTRKLIEEVGKFTEVRLKTIRKAWNEE